MKDKIESIFKAPTSYEHKIELLEFLLKDTAFKFLHWNAERNDAIVNSGGLLEYVRDCETTTKDRLWQLFDNSLNQKP
jgi:hypothetical protein